jgi:hypothetical protein
MQLFGVLAFAVACANSDSIGATGGGGDASGAGANSTTGSAPVGSGGATSGSMNGSMNSSSSGSGCVDPMTDCTPTGTVCNIPVCMMGSCVGNPAPANTPCNDNGGTRCNGMGACVAPTCNDLVKNGAETGVDCGGGTCPTCADGIACSVSADCASGACIANVCAPCGGTGEPCCAGGTCDALPNTCAGNTSTLWGGGQNECNCGVLRAGQVLNVNESRRSCDGRFYLIMQGDGNLVLYYEGFGALWSTSTTGTPANRAVMQADGNFVVLDAADQIWWASWTAGAVDPFLGIQGDGNVVVYDSAFNPYWASNTCCY